MPQKSKSPTIRSSSFLSQWALMTWDGSTSQHFLLLYDLQSAVPMAWCAWQGLWEQQQVWKLLWGVPKKTDL